MTLKNIFAGVAVAFGIMSPIHAAVTSYTNKTSWENAAGSFTSIGFTGYPGATLITNQYESLGVTFTDGFDQIFLDSNSFHDGAGLNGALDEITATFSEPITSIAVDFPGHVQFKLFFEGAEIYQSTIFGGGGNGFFAGLISDVPFNSAVIFDPTGGVFIDDLHFGPPIPAPGALALFGVAAMALSRRRRTT